MGTAREAAEKLRKKRQEEAVSATASGNSGTARQAAELIKKYQSIDTSGVDKAYIDSFITDSNSFLTTAEDEYGGVGWGNASSVYEGRNATWQDLSTRADFIGAWLFKNKSNLDNEVYKSLSDSLYSIRNSGSSVINAFKGIAEHHSQFKTEDEYNEWYEGYKAEQDLLNSDDFEHYSQIGANIENPEFKDTYTHLFNWKAEDINNIVTFSRDNADKIDRALAMSDNSADLSAVPGDYRYRLLRDEEVKIYNYYLGKGDTAKAEEYLASLDDTLNRRHAGQIAETVSGNRFLEMTFAVASGLDQFSSGIRNIDNFVMGTEADPITTTQYASSEIRNGIDGGWGLAYDFAQTVGNQLPSMMVGSLTGGIGGALSMGASAMGNAYADMKRLGYDDGASQNYAFLVGASEAALSYFIGGISKLGGGGDGVFQTIASKVIPNLDNAIARVAIQIGGNMLDEGLEEMIQEVLDPVFKMAVTGEKFEGVNLEDVLYSGLLGALSAGLLEGAPTIAGTAIQSHRAKDTYGFNDAVDLVYESLHINPDNEHAQRMKHRLDDGKSISGYQINRLVEANEESLISQDKAKMKSAVEARLTELGEKGDISALADVIVKTRSGEKLSSAERAVLVGSKYGRRVSTEMNPDVMEDHSSTWAENIGTDRINYDAYNKELLALAEEQAGVAPTDGVATTPIEKALSADETAPKATTTPTKTETPPEVKFKASVDGKTRIGDTEVSIKEVASVKNGKVSLRLEDDSVVSADDVEFGSQDEGLLYENVADMNLNSATANAFIKGYDGRISVSDYVHDFRQAYRYGEISIPKKEMSREDFFSRLTEAQKSLAYNLGKSDAKYKAYMDEGKSVKLAKESAKTEQGKSATRGKLHNTLKPTNETQRASLKALGVLAELLHIDIYTFESPIVKGKRVGENGWYNPNTRELHIDLFAGAEGKGTMLFTAAHELTHHIRETLPGKFKDFADILFEHYGEKGVSVDNLIAQKIKDLRANKRITPNMTEEQIYDLAFEEVVADACESFLADGEALVQIAEKVKAKDKTLWEAIKDFFTNLVARIKEAYKGLSPDSFEGHVVAQMGETAEQLRAMWVDMLVEASEMHSEVEQLADAGIGFDSETRTVYSLRYSTARKDANGNVVDLVTVGKKEFNTESIAQLVAKVTGRSIEDAREWVESEAKIANIIMNNPEFLDFDADNRYEAIKKNSDYPQGTVDLSNLCPKRTEFTSMFDMLQKKYPHKLFTASDVAAMREILKGERITVACGACFVEDRRQLLGEIADTYIGMWKEAVETGKPLQKTNASGNKITLKVTAALAKQYGLTKGADILAADSYIPTQYDLTTYEGFKLLEKNHPIIAMGFNRYNNSRGQQAGRLIEGRAEYNRQILGWSDAKVRSVNNNGGLRIFSFSDFEVVHLLDLVQVIIDCAAKGVKIQGYTKIPSFAKLVRDTGIKLNRSLIPKGQTGIKTVDGKQVLDIDPVEGIDMGDENFLDESDNPNVGNVIIGINPTQIGIAMLEDFIDYIIPFHTNKSKDICKALGVGEWVNYKESQHDKDIATGKASKHNVNIYTQVINKYHPTNKVEFVEAFLKECRVQKKIPRYAEFLNKEYKEGGVYQDEYGAFDYTYREGYHKFLVDFKMFDKQGNILPQGIVTPKLDDAFMAKLLEAEMDKKKTYEFPQAVYDRLDKEFGEGRKKYSDRVKHSDRVVEPIETADYVEMKHHFGATKNYDVAGYLLGNGVMLDFSGKHWGDDYSTSRQVDHRDIQEVLGNRGSNNGVNAMIDMIGNGNIRLMPEVGGINLAVMPNATQMSQLRGYINHFRGEVEIDIDAVGGDTIHSFSYTRGTSSTKILADIKAYFDEGIVPKQRDEGETDIRQFLYSDRVLMGSLFSGGGTLEAGLAYQMLDKEFGVEYDGRIASVYADNHGDHIQVGKVEDFDISKYEDIFYLHASPVCHNFSKAKHGAKELQMDIDSAIATAKHLETAMPQVFTVENAPGYRKSQSLKIITDKLTELGYKWDVGVYNSADYGSATSRNRVILRAVKDGELPPLPTKQKRTNSWDKVTRDLWETLPKSYLRPSFISAIENTPSLPILDADGKVNVNKPLLILTTTSGHTVTYCWEGEICPTLTTKCGEAKLVMPDGNIYAVTPEFMGRIQGLPDDYKYPKAKTRAFTIIGNGIPTHLTKAVIGGVLDSAYEQTHEGRVLYSDRKAYAEAREFSDTDVKYSIRREAPPKETETVYKLMKLGEDKKLYPLFIDGGSPVELGVWYNADSPSFENLRDLPSGYHLIDLETGEALESRQKKPSKAEVQSADNDGHRWMFIKEAEEGSSSATRAAKQYGGNARFYYNLGINGSGSVTEYALRPGWHAGSLPVMEQIGNSSMRNIRADNFVWVEGEISYDIDYQEEAESNPSGENDIPFHIPKDGAYIKGTSNFVTKGMTWYIAGAFKANRILSDREARAIVDDFNENIKDADAPTMGYDFPRMGGRIFNAETMALEDGNQYEVRHWERARDSKKQKGLAPDDTMPIKFQDRSTNSVSNRSLLAKALESVAQDGEERNLLRNYKTNIRLIEAEQKRLAEVRAEAQSLRFKKGKTPEEMKRVKDLDFEAKQLESRINAYDRKLLDLEANSPLKAVLAREKAMAYKRAEKKGKEALKEQREKDRERHAKTQRELMTRYQESRKKGIEGRHKTEMRYKIKKVVNELNEYLKNTKEKHVPIGLQKVVAEALDVVNMDTVGAEERLAKIHEQLKKVNDPFEMEHLLEKYRRISEQGERLDAKLERLKSVYDSILTSTDPMIANSHDEVISNTIAKVVEDIGDTSLRNMNLDQLEAVYDMYRMILTSIRNANKAFKAAKGEEISTIANGVISELKAMKRKTPYSAKALQALSQFDWNNLKPVYAFERIGSANFTKVFKAVRAGEDVWARDMTDAQSFLEEQKDKHGYDSFDFDKKYTFASKSGDSFELDLGEIMSLYAYAKDAHAKGHLTGDGFVFDPKKEVVKKTKAGIKVAYNLVDAASYNISEETLAEIVAVLESIPGAKDFVDAMQDYLSTTMGDKGNEVSLALYDIKLFKNKVYFPLKVSHTYMAIAKEKAEGKVRVKNKGFTKDRKEGAKNSVVLTSFMDVWADHVQEMSMYHAFTLPLEDFRRVFGYTAQGVGDFAPESVRGTLIDAHGNAAEQYLDQFFDDINGGARVDSTTGFINKMMGLFKKSAVFASLSVVIQQPSAIARATALVDAKYFVGKPEKTKHKETWAEVKKYAPVAIIKEMGYFDTGMGRGSVEWLKGDKTWKDYVDDGISYAPALADELAWCAIWKAVKRETLHTHKHLQPNSEAFLQAVGERFTEVIVKTQVYDSTLARSGNMRSKDTGMKMATAFMAEPTTSINMLFDAIIQGRRGNKRYARKAIGGVLASMILNSVLVSFVYAGRDDDEDETYVEKYVGTLTEEMLDSINPLTLIPFVKDIVSIVQGYDVERSDMAVITDLINAWKNLDSDNRSVYRKIEDFAGAVASIFGLPVKNIMRDARGIYNTARSFTNGEKTTGEGIKNAIGEGITGKENSNGNQLYKAMVKGDTEQIERIKGRYKDQSAINSAIRKALRDNDPRIKRAAKYAVEGDMDSYNRLLNEILAEGHFSKADIKAAAQAEINAMLPEEETSSTSASKEVSFYETEYVFNEIVEGDTIMAQAMKEDIIRAHEANGKTRDEAEASFNNSFTSYVKKRYEEGDLAEYEAKSMLINFCGKSTDEAESKLKYWDFQNKYPDYDDLSESAVGKYYEYAEPKGISADLYYRYYKEKSKCKGVDRNGDGRADNGTLKAEILALINSLPLSSYQKDALYRAEGWKESTIWEAPWH